MISWSHVYSQTKCLQDDNFNNHKDTNWWIKLCNFKQHTQCLTCCPHRPRPPRSCPRPPGPAPGSPDTEAHPRPGGNLQSPALDIIKRTKDKVLPCAHPHLVALAGTLLTWGQISWVYYLTNQRPVLGSQPIRHSGYLTQPRLSPNQCCNE